MSDFVVIDFEEESEGSQVEDLIDDFDLLKISSSSDFPAKSDPITNSLSGSTLQVIQNDNPLHFQGETIPQPFEERKEFSEDSNKESEERMVDEKHESSPGEDLEVTNFQQNDIQNGQLGENKVKDLTNEKVQIISHGEFQHEGNGSSQCFPENVDNKEEKSKIPNKGLRNLGNTCYINALLQCLYHVERFREYILQVKEQEGLPLLGKLANFFIAMKTDDYLEIDKAHEDLLGKILEIRCEIIENMQGDSTALFRAITEELSFQHEDYQVLPQLEMFAGSELIKTKTCSSCKVVKRTSQLLKILEVRDVNFLQINQTNYFQSPEENQFCQSSGEKKKHFCDYKTSGLPEILVIRIQDTVNCEKRVEILPELFLKQIDPQSTNFLLLSLKILVDRKMVVHYEFLAGILNFGKGKKGIHSVEISRHGDLYYEFNDFRVREIRLEGVKYHPKLLFYKRC